MVDLRRRGTRWNVFGITTHETFELDGGLTHFLEGRMDASFGTTPIAMAHAIRLIERGLVDTADLPRHLHESAVAGKLSRFQDAELEPDVNRRVRGGLDEPGRDR